MFASWSAADVYDGLDVGRNPESQLGSEGRELVFIWISVFAPSWLKQPFSLLIPAAKTSGWGLQSLRMFVGRFSRH